MWSDHSQSKWARLCYALFVRIIEWEQPRHIKISCKSEMLSVFLDFIARNLATYIALRSRLFFMLNFSQSQKLRSRDMIVNNSSCEHDLLSEHSFSVCKYDQLYFTHFNSWLEMTWPECRRKRRAQSYPSMRGQRPGQKSGSPRKLMKASLLKYVLWCWEIELHSTSILKPIQICSSLHECNEHPSERMKTSEKDNI